MIKPSVERQEFDFWDQNILYHYNSSASDTPIDMSTLLEIEK